MKTISLSISLHTRCFLSASSRLILHTNVAKGILCSILFLKFGIVFISCSSSIKMTTNGIPQINIDAFPSGGGNVEKQDTGEPGVINVDVGTNLLITGSAKNPNGGIKQFSIELLQAGNSFARATVTNPTDASNRVADPLHILGTNGAGGAGSQSMVVNNLIAPLQVKTAAVTFGGKDTSFLVTYAPVSPKQRGRDQDVLVKLKRNIGSNLYTADFPSTPMSGSIVAIGNNSGAEVILLKKGFSASNCANNLNPSAWLIIGPGGQTFPADMHALFGPSLKLPVSIIACANPEANAIADEIEIRVTFHVN